MPLMSHRGCLLEGIYCNNAYFHARNRSLPDHAILLNSSSTVLGLLALPRSLFESCKCLYARLYVVSKFQVSSWHEENTSVYLTVQPVRDPNAVLIHYPGVQAFLAREVT